MLFLFNLRARLNLKGIIEIGTLLPLRLKFNDPVELGNDKLANHKTQAYTFCIDLFLFVFYGAKQFENVFLVFFFNATSSVYHLNFYHILIAISFTQFLYDDLDGTVSFSKFNSVAY